MAQVWRALDLTLDRWVAVKILHGHLADDDAFVARFRHEARAAARLNHRCIVAVYDTVSNDGVDAIVMELVKGVTLREQLEVHGPLRPARAVEIAADVAEALHVAHSAGIVHRDVKPANIMLADDDRVLVTDFGIAKAEGGADLTDTGSVLGTAKYVAPEQLRGEDADQRTDVYALGAVLYEMLAGSPPFQSGTEAATALARLHCDPPSLAEHDDTVPVWLDSVVTRALARRPESRFADAKTMAEALRLGTAVDPGSPLVRPDDSTTVLDVGVVDDPSRSGEREGASPAGRSPHRWLSRLLVLTLAAVAAGVALMLFADGEREPESTRAAVPQARIEPVEGRSFDPFGTGQPGENDSLAPMALDGDVETEWPTEGYSTPTMGPKAGVGYHVVLPEPATIRTIELTTRIGGWDATVHVADGDAGTFEAWGDPVGTIIDAPAGTTQVDLEDSNGSDVLVWFTKLAPDPDRFRVRIQEIDVFD